QATISGIFGSSSTGRATTSITSPLPERCRTQNNGTTWRGSGTPFLETWWVGKTEASFSNRERPARGTTSPSGPGRSSLPTGSSTCSTRAGQPGSEAGCSGSASRCPGISSTGSGGRTGPCWRLTRAGTRKSRRGFLRRWDHHRTGRDHLGQQSENGGSAEDGPQLGGHHLTAWRDHLRGGRGAGHLPERERGVHAELALRVRAGPGRRLAGAGQGRRGPPPLRRGGECRGFGRLEPDGVPVFAEPRGGGLVGPVPGQLRGAEASGHRGQLQPHH